MLQRLITLLKTIEQVEEIKEIVPSSIKGPDGEYDYKKLHPFILRALEVADCVLITEKGEPDYNAIRALKAAGFNVTRGEYDSFGWLSGCIHTSKGIIFFG